MIVCRVLPHEAADGPTNMATDEALLESVAADPTRAVFRTYSWSEPTLSLGYFQPFALTEAEDRWRVARIIRRATGGGALWHHYEVTYATVIPRDHPLARRGADLYRAVHAAIAGLLMERGLIAIRRGEEDASDGAAPKPFLCFADRDAEDVVSGQVKLVGSAQRRRAGAILQHGSLLLARSATTPELAGASDLAPLDTNPLAWTDQLAVAIPRAIGATVRLDDFTREECRLTDRFATEMYRNPSWTRKR